jgi:hypothetical protein
MGKPVGNPPLNLTESQIRYAMENTFSNRQAAKFLSVCYNTYLKYAEDYIRITNRVHFVKDCLRQI